MEIINYIFRKIITLNEFNILESRNEYYQKQVLKNSPKKPFCPPLDQSVRDHDKAKGTLCKV